MPPLQWPTFTPPFTGARMLAELWRCDESDIVYPKTPLKFQRYYEHRKGVIDIHIAFRNWAEQSDDREMLRFDPYYFRPNKRPLTQFRFKPDASLPLDYAKVIEPDAIIKFREENKVTLAAIELHWATDTRRIAKQLDRHITALSQNLISERYKHSEPHVVFSVHKNPTTRKSVQAWFDENEEGVAFKPFFRWFDYDVLTKV